MSEIKGQLLGIFLVLIVFASVSLVVSGIFKSTTDKITEKTESTIENAGQEVTSEEDDDNMGPEAHPMLHF